MDCLQSSLSDQSTTEVGIVSRRNIKYEHQSQVVGVIEHQGAERSSADITAEASTDVFFKVCRVTWWAGLSHANEKYSVVQRSPPHLDLEAAAATQVAHPQRRVPY